MTDPMPSDSQPSQPVAPESEPAVVAATSTMMKPGSMRPRGSMWINVALGVALLIAIGGVGFAAGRMTAPAAAAADGNGRFGGGQFPGGYFRGGGYFNGRAGGAGGLGGNFGAGGVSLEGTVDSISGDTLTLKLANGQTVQVSLTGTTTYHAQASATAGDVKAGTSVIVRVNLDRGQGGTGTTSATDVTIAP
jgi:hypothetical protein